MQIVCLGLLLFSLTWAAPTFKAQTEKTKQDCVEEQRITYKGHHKKNGYYMFKYVYTSPGRKNQTNIKQEEKNQDNIALQHSGRRRDQESAPKENIVEERQKNLLLLGANKNNQSSKSQNLFENRQTVNDSISNKENVHNNLKMSTYPESTGNNGAEDGGDAISKLHDQEENGTALIRNNMQHIMEPGTVIEHLEEDKKEIKHRNVLSKIPASANYSKAPSKGKKNHHRDSQAQNIPVKGKITHHTQDNTDYLKQLRKIKKIPSDFEGSGYPDLQEIGDNDISPFSGDGQPFKDVSGKGETIDPDLEGADIQTEFSGPNEAETTTPEAGGPGFNDIPEKEENGRSTTGTRDETTQEANTADVSLVESSNDIIGSTDFKKLPGKEGTRVDAESQNAHQGKIEFHYPHVPSKEKRKEGSSDVTKSTNYNEIPKNGKESSRKGIEHSNRNQVTPSKKHRFPSKGKSQGQLIPSHGLDNEIKNEIGSHSDPNNEETITKHSRKNHHDHVPHRQDNSAWNKGMPQRKGSWGYRKPHSNRRFRPPKKPDSSESSDSGSSSESDGD
ncbi:PREDICTED: matrix extracellular phosphoglycoprotein isoform X1 [Hipposideros armiger]|uniref:Matrix extracellular phosphoglycoprotein isoform X1 n=2 Tax=Hipposideros armiger TaxID=186990 RepID=A0A8B7TIY3_HIPAR|nr:PREDICTED: matrix extracellular phosphoglycoprotein isoform X1 [Hipposideros armiger]